MTKPKPPTTDVLISAAPWKRALPTAAALCRRAAAAAWEGAPAALKRKTGGGELAVVLTTDAAIRKLNRTWRGKDKPTNVLSFPAAAAGDLRGPGEFILGDVVVAYATVAKEAKEAGKSLKDHLSHMVVHGVLHLLGYDHETTPDAETMESLETKILSRLGVSDPYSAPAAASGPAKTRGTRSVKTRGARSVKTRGARRPL